MLAFFYLFSASVFSAENQHVIEKAFSLQLAQNPTWSALLHLKYGIPQIKDPKFLLSSDNFTASAELIATLNLFTNDSSQAYCRFPARFLFLAKYLQLDFEPSTIDCSELQAYQTHVPFDQVNLIYASEVLSSASSMMGHAFLNVSGINLNANQVSHSISFFTEFNTFNPFKLIYDGMIGGMQGLLIVRPSDVDLNRYSMIEGRNIWSYQLDLDESARQLIKAHIWELKDIDIQYLFQNYNCATLTLYLLSVAKPELKDAEKLYVSPIDVVKAVDQFDLVKSKAVRLARDWERNMLSQEMDADLKQQLESLVLDGADLNFSQLDLDKRLLAKEYLSLLLESPSVKEDTEEARYLELQELAKNIENAKLLLDLTQYKNPINSPQDSILGVRTVSSSGKNSLDLTFLPASHQLYGDNRQFFTESELKIAEVVVRKDLENSGIKLQSLTLYSVKSYVPSNANFPHYSGAFYLGYRHLLNKELRSDGVLELSGAIGKTTRVHRDIMLYGMLGFGLAGNNCGGFVYAAPHVGAIVNMISDTKLIADYKMSFGQFSSDNILQTTSLTYAWYGLENTTLNLSFKSDATDTKRINEFGVSFEHHF